MVRNRFKVRRGIKFYMSPDFEVRVRIRVKVRVRIRFGVKRGIQFYM